MAWRQLTQTSGPDHIRWYQGPSCACYGSQARTPGLRGDHRDIIQHCVLIYNGPACRLVPALSRRKARAINTFVDLGQFNLHFGLKML